MSVLQSWIKAKYTGEQPDDDRFKDVRGEYHSSNVAQCHRRWYWDFKREDDNDDWSVYFELGRMFERAYGRALKHHYGEDRVKQDVMIEIRREEFDIVGEADWVIFEEDINHRVDKVILHEDGTRTFLEEDRVSQIRDSLDDLKQSISECDQISFDADSVIGKLQDAISTHNQAEFQYTGQIQKVIETKTTKKIEWRERYGHKPQHLYQVQCYMWAMDCPGEIAYMTRNELDEMVFEFERDKKIETDIHIRCLEHHRNLAEDGIVPETDPIKDNRCKYCDYKSECQVHGGSRWK